LRRLISNQGKRCRSSKGKLTVNHGGFYCRILYSCLLWWAIGVGIGLLFTMALDIEMKQSLAVHLENGISFFLNKNSPSFTYFLKRCLTYTQLLLLIYGLEHFIYGYLGVRILMLCRGFIYGFSQTAWVVNFGIKGILYAMVSYFPHNLLFASVTAWIEWQLQKNALTGQYRIRQMTVVLSCFAVLLAWVESYASQTLFRACM